MRIDDVKIGMKVLCVGGDKECLLHSDGKYIVEDKSYITNAIKVRDVEGWWDVNIFEPVPPVKDYYNRSKSECAEPSYKLEVGCKVMLKCDHSQKGKITSMKSEDYLVGVLWDGAEYPITAYNPDDFIVLEPAPKFTDFKTYSKHLFEAGNIITKEEFYKEYRHTLDELTGVTRGYDWGNISHKSPFDDCTYQSEKIYQDIEKCLEDIKKEPLDKYGKWALEHYDSIIANRDWAGMLNHVDCMCVIVPITSIMEENKMEIQQINHRKIVDEITGEPVTAVGIHEGLFPLYITKENKYILLKEHYDVEITPDDIKKIMKDKSKELSKLYYEGFTYGFTGYFVKKVK